MDHEQAGQDRRSPKADAIQPTPNETGELSSLLNGVSCTSSTACTAVGSGFVSDGGSTLVEVWNGATWSIQASPSAHRSVDSGLQSISCISATQCAAAGFEFAPRELSLIETWNGSTWSIPPSTNRKKKKVNTLMGVSCSDNLCHAVGASGHASDSTLVEANKPPHPKWTIEASPNPTAN